MPRQWRHLELRRGEHAFVAARDEGSAAEGYLEIERILDTLRTVGGFEPGTPLLLAVSSEDPLLAPVDELAAVLGRAHAAATGGAPPEPVDAGMPPGDHPSRHRSTRQRSRSA